MREPNNGNPYILVIHSRPYGRHYFQDKSGIFYFRVVTPSLLRDHFPNIQKEIRRSLHTASIKRAKQQASRLYLTVTNEFVIALENLSTIEDALKYIPTAICRLACKTVQIWEVIDVES